MFKFLGSIPSFWQNNSQKCTKKCILTFKITFCLLHWLCSDKFWLLKCIHCSNKGYQRSHQISKSKGCKSAHLTWHLSGRGRDYSGWNNNITNTQPGIPPVSIRFAGFVIRLCLHQEVSCLTLSLSNIFKFELKIYSLYFGFYLK